uniref:Insulin-like domain-containing protein n=1 Tax=Plectus sambesii TaxID=2011161 RepID=A0A914WY10_9BILA
MRRLLFALLIVVLVAVSTAASPSGMGVLKMCPPGGQTFTTAWQLTCGMRKKRSTDSLESELEKTKRGDSYRPLKLTEMMTYCCMIGCSFRDLLPYCD